MNCPLDRLYHSEHTWLLKVNNDEALIGITFFAQDTLGDIVEVNCPTTGSYISIGAPCGTLESRKAVTDIISPVNGVVVEINKMLANEPYLVNDDCYGDGWIARIKLANPLEATGLLKPDAYKNKVTGYILG
jgi:glycine cleavage system H protein